MDSDEEFESEFCADESKWSDDETDLEYAYDILKNVPQISSSESSVASTQSRNQINTQPHWSCSQCNQLNSFVVSVNNSKS